MSPEPRTIIRNPPIPALTGLRFLAAASVAFTHITLGMFRLPEGSVSHLYILFTSLSGVGMTLFFVLSGFVIHYNYSASVGKGGSRGIFNFLAARLARLYPLYIACVLFDLWLGNNIQILFMKSGHVPAHVVQAFPYYASMTQSWFYRIIENNNLIYQFGGMPQVAWSVSTEWFFYLAYPLVYLAIAQLRSVRHVFVAAILWSVAVYAAMTFIFAHVAELNSFAVAKFGPIADVGTHDQDSFFRWLVYFSPYSRISEFILGCLTASAYMRLRTLPVSPREEHAGLIILVATILGLAAVHFLMFGPYQILTSYQMNYGFAPLVAILIFCCSRYRNAIVSALSRPYIIIAGEASYSLYLLHPLIILAFSSRIGTVTWVGMVLLALPWVGIVCLNALGMAIIVHAVYETPARRWLRRILSLPLGMPRPSGWRAAAWAGAAIIIFFLPLSIAAERIVGSASVISAQAEPR
jgi:peptidoglycan/LPS O-acetylase OafA/YrhL